MEHSVGMATGGRSSTPSGSTDGLEDEQPNHGEGGKRKKFHPLRAVRKIFRWKVKGAQEVVGPSKKSRSTGELQSVPDEEERVKVPAVPYPMGLSVSHDSVFSPDTSLADSDGLGQGSTLSVNRTPHKLIFKDELFTRVQARRDSDDEDIGLPHSPCTSPTTADVLSRGLQAKASKPRSTCSAGSLSSMFSSENDEDAAVQASQDRRVDGAEPDGGSALPLPLNHKAALHKISVKPKRTHALPRHRMLQVLSAASPRLLPTTPELSEDSSKALSLQPESSEANAEVAEESLAIPTTSHSGNPPLSPKPMLKSEDETDQSSEIQESVVSEESVTAGISNGQHNVLTKDSINDGVPGDVELTSPCQVTVKDSDDNKTSDPLPNSNEAQTIHMLPSASPVTISNNEVTVSKESLLITEDAELAQTSGKDDSQVLKQTTKPKAAELKLMHEIAQFNKRQREMGKTVDYCEANDPSAEMSDVQESIRTLDLAIQSGESKDGDGYDDEDFEEQNNLDILNGNIQYPQDCEKMFDGNDGVPEKISSVADKPEVVPDNMELNTTTTAVTRPPAENIPSVKNVAQQQQSPKEEASMMSRRSLSAEGTHSSNGSVHHHPLERPLSVEIVPFSQRRKEQNRPLSPNKEDWMETKQEEMRRSTPQLNGTSPDAGSPEKNHMSYPIHFRIYKGRRNWLSAEDGTTDVAEYPPKNLEGTPAATPSCQFEVKIQSQAEKVGRPEAAPRAIFLENGVELRNQNHHQGAKERSKSASDMSGSPPKRDDIKPRPFARSFPSKSSEISGEPELFKVFARRSLKQKNVDKHNASDAGDTVVDAADNKPEKAASTPNGHAVAVKAVGGTIVQISELGTTVDSSPLNRVHPPKGTFSSQSTVDQNEKTMSVANSESTARGTALKQVDMSPVPQARESLSRPIMLQNSDSPQRLSGPKGQDFSSKMVTVVAGEVPAKPVILSNGSATTHSVVTRPSDSLSKAVNSPAPILASAAKSVVVKNDVRAATGPQKNGESVHSKSVTIVAPEGSSLGPAGDSQTSSDSLLMRRNQHASRPRFHTSPEVAQEELAKVTGVQKKPQGPCEKLLNSEGSLGKSGKALQRASSVSGVSPSSSGSFRGSKTSVAGAAISRTVEEQQPSWLQLAQQRRELREQRERIMLGRQSDSSFVLETSSKPSRSSKVLDMVSNFQKLQMT